MKTKQIQIEVQVYDNESKLSQSDLALLKAAQNASNTAYAPYSHFFVGAAVKLKNGEVIIGSNQENAAYPAGLCAERTAVFAASVKYPNEEIEAIALAAHPEKSLEFIAISPCGTCRQVLSEYENKQNKPIRVIMEGEDKRIFIVSSINDLLPLKFSDESLS